MPYADLHIHTYYSDGSQSLEEVVAAAKAQGLKLISICDHNLINAYDRLRPACRDAGIALVQGAELDVLWNDLRLHLLAYNFDPTDAELSALLRKCRWELDQRSVDMIDEMEKAGEQVSLAEYTAYEMPRGRGGWKGINYLYDKGFSESVMGAMAFHGRFGHYKPSYASFEEACRVIRRAGGVPVLAHPGVYWLNRHTEDGETRCEQKGDVPAMLTSLCQLGLGGVECYYPWHDEAFTKLCVDFCEANGLCITCGCDGHGVFCRMVEDVIYDIGILDVPQGQLRLDGIYP